LLRSLTENRIGPRFPPDLFRTHLVKAQERRQY
jgi:hypothetical protein